MNGGATYRVTASKEEADRIAAHAMAVVPLYEHPPQPTLTDAEREAIQAAAVIMDARNRLGGPVMFRGSERAATLRGLLERLGGER